MEDFINNLLNGLGNALSGGPGPTPTPTPAPTMPPIKWIHNSTMTPFQTPAAGLDSGQNAPTNVQARASAEGMVSKQPFSEDELKAGIEKWSGGKTDVPILNNLDALYSAGQQFQEAGLDPYLPTIMALRETQGGRDNANPKYAATIGANDPYNMRNVGQSGNTKPFVDYPDVNTAILGGQNGPYQSQGFVGTILKGPLGAAYRKSGNIGDLLQSYSPTSDNNGTMDNQIANYNYIRNFFTNGGGTQ